ncbi:MAG: zf-HC2 domain-containing protein [Pseudomonadota bacterium]
MKCDESKLFSYLEGISSAEERNEIEEHLKSCKRCRDDLDELQFTIDSFTKFYASHGREGCPGGESLISFKYGTMKEEDAAIIREHIDQCSACREELRLIRAFEKEEQKILDSSANHSPLAPELLNRIKKLKKDSLRERMEKVLKSVMAKGKDGITPDSIPKLLDQCFGRPSDISHAYAFPPDTMMSDTELTLREFGMLTDITFEIGEYHIFVKYRENSLAIQVYLRKKPAKNIEVSVAGEAFGELKAVTDSDGACLIKGIPQEPGHLRIRILGMEK